MGCAEGGVDFRWLLQWRLMCLRLKRCMACHVGDFAKDMMIAILDNLVLQFRVE